MVADADTKAKAGAALASLSPNSRARGARRSHSLAELV
jgi:hypothetical protein